MNVSAAARPLVDGAAPKDVNREVRQLIHVYPDVATRIKRDLGSRFARHRRIQPGDFSPTDHPLNYNRPHLGCQL
jgi:hypothetical protein